MLLWPILILISGATGKKPANDWKIKMSELLDNKILGGRRAEPGEVPWAVSLRFRNPKLVPPSGHYCGGSVVTTRVVVTACHCAVTSINGVIKPHPIRDKIILAGSLKSDPKAEGAQVRRIGKMKYHPKCERDPIDGRGWNYDFAFAVVDKSFNFNKMLQPLQLYSVTPSVAQRYFKQLISNKILCLASGFGFTAEMNGTYTDLSLVLKTINLNIINQKVCTRLLCEDSDDYCNISISKKKHICAMSPSGGDVCKGDSGSALVCEGKAVGLLSWGPRCGEQKMMVPSMYMMVHENENFFNFDSKLYSKDSPSKIRSSQTGAVNHFTRPSPYILLLPVFYCVLHA